MKVNLAGKFYRDIDNFVPFQSNNEFGLFAKKKINTVH